MTKPSRSAKRFWLAQRNSNPAGFHDQVKVTHETTLLFFDVRGRREPLRSRNGRFTAGAAEFSRDELLAALEKAPEAFTPSALLRPVVQDSLLPTAAYFGGPAEVAYMAQSQVVYRHIFGPHACHSSPRELYTGC